MKKIEYVAEYKENKNGSSRKAPLLLGDYDSWEEVLQSKILWGSINFTRADTLILKKSEKFPTNTENVTYFDKALHWTFVQVLSITKREIISTSELIWKI